MVTRIQYRQLLRLAQRHGSGSSLAVRYSQPKPSILAVPSRRLQPLSTSPTRRQEPRHTPVPPNPEQPATAHTEPVDPASTPTEPPKKKPRLAPRLILAIACTLLGATLGSSARLLLNPPTPLTPGSEQDAYTIRVLHEQASKLPIVQQLTSDPATWEESWDAYESLSPEHRAQHISAGALAGSRGVGGYQRVWRHKSTGELVSVIYFGSATTGWPGVVHGGCLATILDESCGRAAFREWGGRAGVTASLGLEYKNVTLANGFYVVRVRVRPEEELPEKERGKRHYKCFVDATVEDAATGTVTVVAEALFVGGQGKNGKNKVGGVLRGNAQDAHLRF
ncbi:HotDog domain-containing protein [Achaetomium macrosporum]|uniref:HotDog domain-containing protein n=1 Tax=Achaetomium macrosporum TaxID=79813 RepID=A0AAN7C6H0_9PEZI|nr:HotDog domain-containing protein [Achaetomium macrosporum]